MKQSEMFASIKHAVDTAAKGDRTVTVQIQIIKFHYELTSVSAKEFVEKTWLKPSLVTLFTDSMKLAARLREYELIRDFFMGASRRVIRSLNRNNTVAIKGGMMTKVTQRL